MSTESVPKALIQLQQIFHPSQLSSMNDAQLESLIEQTERIGTRCREHFGIQRNIVNENLFEQRIDEYRKVFRQALEETIGATSCQFERLMAAQSFLEETIDLIREKITSITD